MNRLPKRIKDRFDEGRPIDKYARRTFVNMGVTDAKHSKKHRHPHHINKQNRALRKVPKNAPDRETTEMEQ